ncbi:MAG: hypothetical protein E7118_01785 [Bacteroidales bacterium]|nr:hypothetical protein [Bacteroidales bacterium]
MKKRISSTLSLALMIISAHAAYCPFNEYSWNNDKENNGAGKDETGMDWDTYMNTEEGRALALKIRMTSAIDYLMEDKSDIAPYWYVRHGFRMA